MKKCIGLCAFFYQIALLCAEAQQLTSPPPFAQLQAYSHHQPIIIATAAHPASLTRNEFFGLAVYGERKFMLAELSQYLAIGMVPAGAGRFGFQAGVFGNMSYRQTRAGIAYARSIGKLDVGVRLNYFGFRTAGYGQTSTANGEAGMLLRLSERFCAGINLFNPFGAGVLKDPSENLPSVYTAGFGYDVSKKFFLGAQLSKEGGVPLSLCAGMSYRPHESVVVRTGFSSPDGYYVGAGVQLREYFLETVASWHPYLGLTPALSIQYLKLRR